MSSQIWQSTEDTGPYGSFPQYPLIPIVDNSGRGQRFTPGSTTSADYASFGTIEFDHIKFPGETVFNVPAAPTTIQAAIDQLDGLGPINARINIAVGTYYETLKIDRTNSSPAADQSSRTVVQLIGDTRPCAGMTFMHTGTSSALDSTPVGQDGMGQDGMPVEVVFQDTHVTVTFMGGEVYQPDFTTLGVVEGDILIVCDADTIASEHIVTSVEGNVIWFEGSVGEFYNARGTSLTICPNVVVTPTTLYQPAIDVSGACVSLVGIRFRTDPSKVSFVSHVLRATKSLVIATGCMFDDFCHCAYEDCIGLVDSHFSMRRIYPGTRKYSSVTVAGGFNNCILAEKRSIIDADYLSTLHHQTAHGVALVDKSTMIAVSHNAHGLSSGVQLYVSDGSSAKIARPSYVGQFLAILAQYGSSVQIGGAVNASETLGRTTITDQYIAVHARGGSTINVDGEYNSATAVGVYLASASNMAFAPSSSRNIIDYWWYNRYFTTDGCKLTFADRNGPSNHNSVSYDNLEEEWSWWQPLRTDADTHILNTTMNLVVVIQPYRNDYMGNYPYLGRTFTVVCNDVGGDGGQHVLLLDSGRFGGNGVDFNDNHNIAIFTATDQFITFCVINTERTVVIASKGVTFSNGW